MSNVKITLTPRQALAAAAVLGRTRDNTTGSEAFGAFREIVAALGVKRPDLLPSPFTVTGYPMARLNENDFAKGLQNTAFPEPVKFDFNKFALPKSVVFFEYPEHGTGKLKSRLLKVETDTPNGLAGYEVDLDTGAMSWTYKNFTKAKIENLQKQ